MDQENIGKKELEIREIGERDWFDISLKLDVVEIRLLDRIYNEDTYVINKLKATPGLKASKKTIYNKVKRLDELDLVNIISKNPMVIDPIEDIRKPVSKLIALGYKRITGRDI